MVQTIRAKESFRNRKYPVDDHFEDVHDMIELGKSAISEVEIVKLSRYACCLIIQNADLTK